ncbi:MAG TPA: ATP-binding protein, partial [Sphingobacteriaceae bacterium]
LWFFITVFYSCRQKDLPYRVLASADYKKGESFIYNQNDSAYFYFNRVTSGSKDSLLVAMAYNQLAAIQSDAGDYIGSQESLTRSLGLLDEQNPKHRYCLASDYNELGITSYNLKIYDAALRYYDKAVKLTTDQEFLLVILNNKAVVYQKKGQYEEALKLYDLVISKYQKNRGAYARVLSNRARTKWLRDPGYQAAPELLTALQIRREEKSLRGQTTSYAHLTDYYSDLYPDSALYYARRMYSAANEISSTDDQLEALQKLIRLSGPAESKAYFSVYQQFSDSVQTARNAAKNRYALIRFEAARHKTENLELQKENTELAYQIVGAGVLIVALVVFFLFWYRRRSERLKLEAEQAIRENQLRISRKVHDVVANGLYRMMSEIENREALDRDQLLDRIEDMYERSRDLSYERAGTSRDEFHRTLASLLTSFATGSTKVLILGNSELLWSKADPAVRQEILHVLQELMVNMKKHSRASNVVVRFGRHEGDVVVEYSDDGIGLPQEVEFGNGLSSTGNRIQGIGGTITFDGESGKGTRIRISFPGSR